MARGETYEAMHRRVARLRGVAREHECVDCHGPAAHWSYAGDCPDERQGICPFCLHLEHYSPRCVACHFKHDGYRAMPGGAQHYNAKLTEKIVREARVLNADGVSTEELSRRYGVHQTTMWRAVNRITWAGLS